MIVSRTIIPCVWPWLEVIRELAGPLLWFHSKCQKLILFHVWACIFLCPFPCIPLPSSSARGSIKISSSCSDLPQMCVIVLSYTHSHWGISPLNISEPGLFSNSILLLFFVRFPILLFGSQIPQVGWRSCRACPAEEDSKPQPRNCSHLLAAGMRLLAAE